MDIQVVFFDYGGVIADEGFVHGLTVLAEEKGLDSEQFFWDVRQLIIDEGYVYGRVSEADFWKAFRARFGFARPDAELRQVILSRFVVRPWVLALSDLLRKNGVRTAILSDQTNWLDELDAEQHFSTHFEHVFNSFHHHITKSEQGFFTLALDHMGVAPGAALHIDDARSNIAVCREVGLHCHYYQDKQGLLNDMAERFPEMAGQIRAL